MDDRKHIKNVIYVSYDGMTDPLGQSQVLPYLCGLSKLNYNIVIVSFEKATNKEKLFSKISVLCAENNIVWLPLSYTKRPPILSTVYDIILLLRKVKELHNLYKFNIIHCRSYIASFAGVYLKNKYQVPFIFDMRGFWVDERVDGKIWNLNNPIYKIIYSYFKKKEEEFLNCADYIISLTNLAKTEILSWKNIKKDINIEVIPCCVDLDLFNVKNIDKKLFNTYQQKFNISEKNTVLSYIGSLGTWYMINEIIEFYSTFRNNFQNSKLLIVTHSNKDEIIKLCIRHQIPLSEVIVTIGERSEMPTLISLSSFSLFFIRPLFSKKASSPTKQGEIMGLGVPIICNRGIGDSEIIIKDSGAGIVVENFSNDDYKNAIEKLKKTTFDNIKIQNGAEKYYSLKKGIIKYKRIYDLLSEN